MRDFATRLIQRYTYSIGECRSSILPSPFARVRILTRTVASSLFLSWRGMAWPAGESSTKFSQLLGKTTSMHTLDALRRTKYAFVCLNDDITGDREEIVGELPATAIILFSCLRLVRRNGG